jgi:hypothetical protein
VAPLSREFFLAEIRMLKYGEEYVTQPMEEYEAKIRAKMLDTLKRKAAAMGFQLSPLPT